MNHDELKALDPALKVNFVPVQSKLNWDEYFILLALIASYRSKDPNTKVGCVFVDQNHHQISMGYNGAIAGVDESLIPWGNDRSVPPEYQKYGYVMHSEANAIAHANRSLANSTAYVTLFPCNECAKLIASQKVAEVVYLSDKYSGTAGNRISKRIFDLSNIRYRAITISPSLVDDLSQFLIASI